MERIFNGKIEDGEASQFLIDGEIVAEELEDIGFQGNIHLRYTISKSEISPETVEEEVLRSLFGEIDAEHGCIPFSEWTGFVAWDDTLKVGGHDLIRELLSFEGQYCYLHFYTT